MSDQLLISFEEWRPVKGYEGIYSVSNCGNVRREITPRSPQVRLLKLTLNVEGYHVVSLSKGKATQHKVHRLVAIAFLEPSPDKPDVNHKNGRKTDNRPDNIEWCSVAENNWHNMNILGVTMAFGEAHGHAKLRESDVNEIREHYAAGASISGIARGYGMDASTIGNVVHGTTWRHLLPHA